MKPTQEKQRPLDSDKGQKRNKAKMGTGGAGEAS